MLLYSCYAVVCIRNVDTAVCNFLGFTLSFDFILFISKLIQVKNTNHFKDN